MNCPICEQDVGKNPAVFQRIYFPKLLKDESICKRCYESLPEKGIYKKLAPSGDIERTELDIALQIEKKLRRKYSASQTVGVICLAIVIIRVLSAMSYIGNGIPKEMAIPILVRSLATMWLVFALIAFGSARMFKKRIMEIGRMSPREKEELALRENPAHCGICNAIQPFKISSLRGGHFPDGAVFHQDSYPDLSHDVYVCEGCRSEYPSNEAIYGDLVKSEDTPQDGGHDMLET